ncbi:MAG: hypothetical protein ACFFCS_12870 [Candidatus Hodarchaeota archaeon]
MTDYSWYSIVKKEDGLEQGDFIINCPIMEPVHDIQQKTTMTNYIEYDVVVMSQSCDLQNKKLDLVLVCPFWPMKVIEEHNSWFKSKKSKEKLRKGNQPNYHLLNKPDLEEIEIENDFLVVDFRSVFSVPYNFLVEYIAKIPKRMRLLPPYKEHLSQSFARFFMRVGLPVDIEPFV